MGRDRQYSHFAPRPPRPRRRDGLPLGPPRSGLGWRGYLPSPLCGARQDFTWACAFDCRPRTERTARRHHSNTQADAGFEPHGPGPHPDVAREMQMMLDKSPNERSGIISTVQGFLKIYRDPRIAAATSRSDLRISDLMNHQRPVSLYLVIPVKDMDRIQPLLRLVLNQIVKGLAPRMEGTLARWKLLLMLDEFCVLGHMELLSKMLPFIPGYGIRTCVIAQNLTQIEAAYGRDQPIVQTCETLLALTPNRDDIQTAEFLSKLAGDTTVVERHRSWNNSGRNISEQKIRRALITPSEVLELPTTKALIFKRGAKPILADQFIYYRDARFDRWSKLAPPAQSNPIREETEILAIATTATKEPESEAIELTPSHWSVQEDDA